MSGKKKRRQSEESSEDEQEDVYTGGEEIQVEFEGRTPQETDFHGIKTLLQQLFLKARVDLSALAEIIIGQNYVGSVIKQSDSDIPEDEDEEMEDDTNDVFGITTVVSLKDTQGVPCIQQIRGLLMDLCSLFASDATKLLVERVLQANTAMLINERFVNIPPQISAPLLQSLKSEIDKARMKNKPFNFDYYLMICKMHRPDEKNNSNKENQNQNPEILWSNAEEEIIVPEALDSFEFCVKEDVDSGLTGNWLEEDNSLLPFRKVLILEANKLEQIVNSVVEYVS